MTKIPCCLNKSREQEQRLILLPSRPSRVAQSVVRLAEEPEVPGSIPGPAIYLLIQEGQLSVTGESLCT